MERHRRKCPLRRAGVGATYEHTYNMTFPVVTALLEESDWNPRPQL